MAAAVIASNRAKICHAALFAGDIDEPFFGDGGLPKGRGRLARLDPGAFFKLPHNDGERINVDAGGCL